MRKFTQAVYVFAATNFLALPVFAEDGTSGGAKAAYAIAAAIAIGVAAMGGAIGQGRAAAAALDGIARNPAAQGKILVPMIIALALIESLVIYALIIAFGLSGKA